MLSSIADFSLRRSSERLGFSLGYDVDPFPYNRL